MRRRQLIDPKTQPHSGHRALAELEAEFDGKFLLVTQNVDNLHELAGSVRLIHMHGELMKSRCNRSQQVRPIRTDMTPESRCSCCHQRGTLRPDIVWFGEIPMAMDKIYDALEGCDLFLSIGTSGTVYPANGFVQVAQAAGAHTVELNLQPSRQESAFAEQIYGPASGVVPQYVERLLTGQC
jgi:NAD-dependent deacetylase